jgi:hypothetical protein
MSSSWDEIMVPIGISDAPYEEDDGHKQEVRYRQTKHIHLLGNANVEMKHNSIVQMYDEIRLASDIKNIVLLDIDHTCVHSLLPSNFQDTVGCYEYPRILIPLAETDIITFIRPNLNLLITEISRRNKWSLGVWSRANITYVKLVSEVILRPWTRGGIIHPILAGHHSAISAATCGYGKDIRRFFGKYNVVLIDDRVIDTPPDDVDTFVIRVKPFIVSGKVDEVTNHPPSNETPPCIDWDPVIICREIQSKFDKQIAYRKQSGSTYNSN